MNAPPRPGLDLGMTEQEQDNVRAALRFLRLRCGGWKPLGAAMRMDWKCLSQSAGGRAVGPRMAFRVARLAGVGVDAVLAGEYPPEGVCPHCGK